ncbi:Scr1 family TA system antitoxin-like transcriptional regulator [Nocardiopsis sp. CT-R113]|uniref:Scr1 family TA system antitoxin-like transcriptional regulator n=1 Tax=Nocardiopsis codii TaxID=3065942 RepID=A0ABU7KD39_9ACTN|nr:Scr1 family TA system antitoxin-like transcriptional regulator [Nocardiopsis sp. CT-R113]MEE2040153.1 Scr1 family TA system antitoxin-like transcriptional regulator [Nocardiopsis sp. CT-R113]
MTTTAPEVFTGGQKALMAQEAVHATRQYSPGTVPGLLQTLDYATEVANALPHLSDDREDHIRLRMARGRQVRECTHLRHQFIVGAAVHDLDPHTPLMDAQRAHLADLDQLGHIDIRVRPARVVLTDPTGFTIRAGRVWIEAGDTYFVASDDVQQWVEEWGRLWEEAVPLSAYQQGQR